MPTLSEQFATIFRDFETPGVPGSGEHEPIKSEIRALGALIEDALIALEMAGVGVIRKTQAALYADLAHGVDTFALVLFDTDAAKNGFYVKVGASGAGSWTGPSSLPTAILTDALAALEDAIDAKNLAAAWAEGTLPGGAGTKSAKEHALDADAAADTATVQAGIATGAAAIASAAKTDIQAISGVKGVFATKAAANAGLSGLANGTLVLVKADETNGGASWHYLVTAGAYVSKGAAINNGKLVVPMNVSPAASGSTTIFEVVPDEAQMNSAGGNDAVVSAMRLTVHSLDQGPTGHEDYYNRVIGFGHNINDSFAPLNAAQPAASSRIEFKFAQGGASSNHGAEFHPASLTAVGNFEFRAYSAFIAHNKDKWHLSADGTAVMQAAYQHVLADGRNVPRIQCEFSDTTARMYWMKGNQAGSRAPQIYYAENNSAPVVLINAAGTAYVDAFKLTSGDRMLFSNPETRQMAQSTGILGFGGVNAETQFLSPAAGSIGQVVTWQNVTGDFSPVVYHGSVSGNAMLIARNTGSGGKIGRITAANNGVAYHSFEDANAGSAGFQIRQPAGAATLEIDAGYRGAVGAVIMAKFHRTSGMAEFPNGALLGLKTVGTLPTPTTGDKGRSFYCTNARNAGEGAGAGTGSIVACNGAAYTIPGIAGAVAA